MNLKYLFIGNAGGGTSFTANYLTDCGFICGHEMFGYFVSENKWYTGASGDIIVNNQKISDIALGESNYTAIEWCDYHPMNILPIVLIMRNPLHVLQSQMAINMRSGESINVEEIISNIIKRYEKIENHARKVFSFRIEYDCKSLCDFLKIEYKNPKKTLSKKHNSNHFVFSWNEIKSYKNNEELKKIAKRYDYCV